MDSEKNNRPPRAGATLRQLLAPALFAAIVIAALYVWKFPNAAPPAQLDPPPPALPAPAVAEPVNPAVEPAAFHEQTWDEAVNLLKSVNIDKDIVSGDWRIENGKLSCDVAYPATLELPYYPPKEYDFRVTFTIESVGNVGQVLCARGRQFGWYMGAYNNTQAGFQMIDGKAMPENPTGVKVKLFEANRTYTSLVEVRGDGVKAYVDGTLISQWKTDYKNASLFPQSRLRGTDLLGVWAVGTRTTFHSIQVREVSGKGARSLHGENPPAEF